MAEYIELIDKYRIVQSEDTDYNPPSYDWVDNTGEIVRCKDCKCYRQSSFVDNHMECARSGFPVHSVDFCSRGEKREES